MTEDPQTQLPQVAFSEDDLIQSICSESFYEFLKEFWDTAVTDKFRDNWHIKYLCDELQAVAERVFRGEKKEYDLIINISPGTTKSTIVSVLFPAWVWTRMARAKIIAASYVESLALDLSRRSRDVVKSEKYQRVFGKGSERVERGAGDPVEIRKDTDGVTAYGNTKGGIRWAVGTGGGITGKHGHFILIDDPLDPNRASSDAELASANNWMKSTIPSRKVDKDITPTILIMQRLHQNDPTGRILRDEEEKKTWKLICIPASVSPMVRPVHLRKFYSGEGLMDPVRLSAAVLAENRRRLGAYHYAGQFDQTPVPKEGGLFHVRNLRFTDTPPFLKDFSKLVRYWDKAGTKDGGCWTVGLLMGVTYEKVGVGRFTQKGLPTFFILDVVRGQWATHEREKNILATCQKDNRYHRVETWVEQEPGSGGQDSVRLTVANCAGYIVRGDLPRGDKVLRADPLSVQVNDGNVVVVNAGWTRELVEEFEYFPESTNKDQVDAASGAFSKLCSTKKVGGLR